MSNVTLWTRPGWDVDRWMKDFFGPDRDQVTNGAFVRGFHPAAEVTRDGDDAVVRLELPGLSKETLDNDINVEVEHGRLVIHGERRDERAEDNDGRAVREIRYGSFRRSFRLPAHVTGADAISASYDAGVLTVRVAGAYQNSETRRIAIESR